MYSSKKQWELLKENYREKDLLYSIQESSRLNEAWSWFTTDEDENRISKGTKALFDKVSGWINDTIKNLDDATQDTKSVTSWEDFKLLINVLLNQRKLKALAGKTGGLAAKGLKILSALSGAEALKAAGDLLGTPKDVYELVQMTAELPDEQAEKAELADALNIDDGYSEMVDDRLETGFLKWMSQTYLPGKSGAIAEEEDNINAIFEKYLEERGTGAETVAQAETSGKLTDLEFPKKLGTAYELIKQGVGGLSQAI